MSQTQPPRSWRFRKWLWTRWQTFRFSLNKPAKISAPQPNKGTIKAIPMRQKHPRIPMDILVYDRIPADESRLATRIFVALQLFLNRLFPAMQPNLPEIDPDIKQAFDQALMPKYGKAFRSPVLPSIYQGEGKPELEDLAVQSPYSIYLERDANGALQWDFRELGGFEHHQGLCSLGVRVVFAEDAESRRLEAREIWDPENGVVQRGDKGWVHAKDLAVCAATTHMALTRHFNYIHLICGNHWDITTRNTLPSDHPLYRLLWPSLFNSIYSNHGNTRVQLNPDGDFVNMFSFSHDGLSHYYDAMHKKYDIAMVDPHSDWERRGLAGSHFHCPTQDNLCEVFGLMHGHAQRYVEAYYASDEALQQDEHVHKWLTALGAMVPNGLGDFVAGGITRSGLARLIGGYINEGNSVHDMVGTTLWDYQLWVDKNPVRVHRDGRRIPLDVLQRAINNNFALQIRRAPLLANYKDVALDEKGAALFTQFYDECRALQDHYDKTPTGPWRMEPKNLEINMNA